VVQKNIQFSGEYSVLSFCIGPPCGLANTTRLELNILLYCPPTCANIYVKLPDVYCPVVGSVCDRDTKKQRYTVLRKSAHARERERNRERERERERLEFS